MIFDTCCSEVEIVVAAELLYSDRKSRTFPSIFPYTCLKWEKPYTPSSVLGECSCCLAFFNGLLVEDCMLQSNGTFHWPAQENHGKQCVQDTSIAATTKGTFPCKLLL